MNERRDCSGQRDTVLHSQACAVSSVLLTTCGGPARWWGYSRPVWQLLRAPMKCDSLAAMLLICARDTTHAMGGNASAALRVRCAAPDCLGSARGHGPPAHWRAPCNLRLLYVLKVGRVPVDTFNEYCPLQQKVLYIRNSAYRSVGSGW